MRQFEAHYCHRLTGENKFEVIEALTFEEAVAKVYESRAISLGSPWIWEIKHVKVVES